MRKNLETILKRSAVQSIFKISRNLLETLNVSLSLQDLVILANKVNQRMRQNRIMNQFMTGWYLDTIKQEQTNAALRNVRAKVDAALQKRSSTVSDKIIREKLSPEPVCTRKADLVLSGGSVCSYYKLIVC